MKLCHKCGTPNYRVTEGTPHKDWRCQDCGVKLVNGFTPPQPSDGVTPKKVVPYEGYEN